jgi:hypothetical protein
LGSSNAKLFPENIAYGNRFREMVSINNLNLTKIVRTVSKTDVLRAPIFGTRIFIFTGRQIVMNKGLNTEYELNPFIRLDQRWPT